MEYPYDELKEEVKKDVLFRTYMENHLCSEIKTQCAACYTPPCAQSRRETTTLS